MCSFLFVCTANLTVRYAFSFAAKRRASISLRETRKRTFRDSEPALRRDECECGALVGRKASPKPRALDGFESGTTANAPKKKDGKSRPFSLVHLQGFEPGTH